YEVFKIQSFNSRYSLPILPLYITDHVIFIMAFLLYEFDVKHCPPLRLRWHTPNYIVNLGGLGARSDGATPIDNRRATSDDVTKFSSIDYTSK
ncbi:MAG: palindromic element RPE2 domain-containing protein, partial [Rickettsia sp.]|nr:palindromic element RPE2 domain-containing protein [Rickettsia sp.]